MLIFLDFYSIFFGSIPYCLFEIFGILIGIISKMDGINRIIFSYYIEIVIHSNYFLDVSP